jgi:hypothetical protein
MATWIVHLRLAENLLQMIDGLDEPYFAIGNIAPDSGIPDENWESFNPPPEVLHFEVEVSATFKIADLDFYRQYLLPMRKSDLDVKRFSFLLGYFFHLVTDNLWTQEIGHPTQTRFADEFEANPKFIWEVKRDWYGLDLAYVRAYPESLFWSTFLDAEYTDDYLEFLPRDAIQQRMAYIKELYQRTDERIEELWVRRPNKYLTQEEVDGFIDLGTQLLHDSYRFLWEQGKKTSGASSVLEIILGKGIAE